MFRLKEIERICQSLEIDTNSILNRNYPLSSRDYLTGSDAKQVVRNDRAIIDLANEYLARYQSLPLDIQAQYGYKDLKEIYFHNTQNSKGLKKVYSFSSEDKLQNAFAISFKFAMEAIDNIFHSNGNQNIISRNQVVLRECMKNFNVHYYGKDYIKKIVRYTLRLRNGRTVSDDLRDYNALIQECKNLSIEYSKAIIRGLSDKEREEYFSKYNSIFEREKILLEFVPEESLEGIKIDFHQMKAKAESVHEEKVDGEELNKEEIFQNIFEMVNNGFFLNKYFELTANYSLDGLDNEKKEKVVKELEEISANIFNAILIACQLFNDKERRIAFANCFARRGIDSFSLLSALPRMFNMTEEEACERLKNGFGVHFTTCKICEEICRSKKLVGYGNNAMFTKEEDELIKEAERLQIQNNPEDMNKLNYLFRGWGTGVSSYCSITNGFWMYHTPESLSFLFGNISSRNKERAMQNVLRRTSNLDKETQVRVLQTMSNIWDRLIGNEQEVGCILIDRDAFEYEKDTYYNNGRAEVRERRPYSKGLNSINDNDCKINKNINLQHMKFLKLPTIIKLEALKKEMFEKNVPHGK